MSDLHARTNAAVIGAILMAHLAAPAVAGAIHRLAEPPATVRVARLWAGRAAGEVPSSRPEGAGRSGRARPATASRPGGAELAARPTEVGGHSPERKARATRPPIEPDLSVYAGLGAWIDVFDEEPWAHPVASVARIERHGAKTIYLQTSSYGSKRDIVFRRATARFIRAAHRRDMRIVAWTVPSFSKPAQDWAKARAALSFRTPKGDAFDSFALDIEAAIVPDLDKRNDRLIALSRKIRAEVGPRYSLGAIIPDPGHAAYWARFPYRRVARIYDVMVPMGYFTFRARGYRSVHAYTSGNIHEIRERTGDPSTPIHVIGGIADEVTQPSAKGFVRAVTEHDVLGGSLYDFPITRARTWKALSRLRSLGKNR